MPRPTIVEIPSGEQSWDTSLNDNYRSAWKTSTPVANGTFEQYDGDIEGSAYEDIADLPSAAANEGCVAVVNQGGVGPWVLHFSDGTAWTPIGTQAVDPGDSTAILLATLVTDYNTLLANLRTSGVIG